MTRCSIYKNGIRRYAISVYLDNIIRPQTTYIDLDSCYQNIVWHGMLMVTQYWPSDDLISLTMDVLLSFPKHRSYINCVLTFPMIYIFLWQNKKVSSWAVKIRASQHFGILMCPGYEIRHIWESASEGITHYNRAN